MSCMWTKDGFHFEFNSNSVGCPLNCPLFSCLKLTGCPLSCPLYPYMEVVGSLICMAKFPWAAYWQPTPLPTELPTFSYLKIVGCQLSCPLFPYMEVVGCHICMVKFPWAAHSAAHVQPMSSEVGSSPVFSFFIFGSSGLPTELPTELNMEVVGSLICIAKFPRAANSVAHLQPMGSEVGSSPVFSVWKYFILEDEICCNKSLEYLQNMSSLIANVVIIN